MSKLTVAQNLTSRPIPNQNEAMQWYPRYPVPDQVEMGNDHGNCWLLYHCDTWEVSNKNIGRKKKISISTNSAQVCQACVSGPAGGTDVDDCV